MSLKIVSFRCTGCYYSFVLASRRLTSCHEICFLRSCRISVRLNRELCVFLLPLRCVYGSVLGDHDTAYITSQAEREAAQEHINLRRV